MTKSSAFKHNPLTRLAVLLPVVAWISCSVPPTSEFRVSAAVSNILSTSAHVTISISTSTYSDGSIVAESGVCYSTYSSPSINDVSEILGYGVGQFETEIALAPATKYYLRAYAKTNSGVVYSDIQSFKTAGLLFYGSGSYDSNWGLIAGGDDEWGVMFPPSMLRSYSGCYVTEVRAYIVVPGTYTVTIYTGGTTSPSITKSTSIFNCADSGWKSILLPSSWLLDTNSSLWATLSFSYEAGTYPSAASNGIDNKNARWKHRNGGVWYDVYDNNEGRDLCWLIQVVLNDSKTRSTGDIVLSWDQPDTTSVVEPLEAIEVVNPEADINDATVMSPRH